MDEGLQKDEQFEMEIDNEETCARARSSANDSSEEEDDCWKCGSDSSRLNG